LLGYELMKPAKADKDKIIEDLRSEIESLRTVISMTPGNVYWKNADNVYMGCNNNVANFLNFSPQDIIGKTIYDIVPVKEIADVIDKTDWGVIQNGKEVSIEEVAYNADGSTPAVYLSRKTPLYDSNGKIKGMLGISFDITERKKFEETLRIAKQKAEAVSRAKSQFLAMISHELRTPLTSILGFASLIEQSDTLPEKKQEYLTHLTHSGSYLLSLINSLLDYNKLETNAFELINLPLNLKELIENVLEMLTGTAKIKNLPLILDYKDGTPQQVMSNSRVLRQILINLIGNAIKFTEKGEVIVRVSSTKKPTAEHLYLQIAVEDTGLGIPIHEQKYIFKRFYQLGNVYTRNSSLTGTGLGLAIVKKLVKLLGGTIAVKSTPQKGSTFYFNVRFPTVSNTISPWLPYAANTRILVIQDKMLRNNIHTVLANTIYEVVSSKEAVDILLSAHRNLQTYDILIMDSDLKGIQPDDLLKNIREQNNLHQPLAILLTSTPSQSKKQFWEIQLVPGSADVYAFQNELKTAWESWVEYSNKYITEITPSRNPYILLVEDNQLIQIIHKQMFENLGCRVDVTESATQAFAMLNNNYDMFFVDIGLPDIAGFELIKKIRQQNCIQSQLPIIVLTGYSEEEEHQHCLRVGANEVAIKPIAQDTLKTMLDRYIKT
jgi:two-component system sensor histidine kinase/response regulator